MSMLLQRAGGPGLLPPPVEVGRISTPAPTPIAGSIRYTRQPFTVSDVNVREIDTWVYGIAGTVALTLRRQSDGAVMGTAALAAPTTGLRRFVLGSPATLLAGSYWLDLDYGGAVAQAQGNSPATLSGVVTGSANGLYGTTFPPADALGNHIPMVLYA